MIVHQMEGVFNPRLLDSVAFGGLPEALTNLPTWACWRARTRAYKGSQRVVHVPVHPFKKHQPRNNHPEEWASFEDVLHPRLRKPVDGIGVYLGQGSGLAVVLNADPGLPARLGDQVVYAERSVSGDGLTVVVRDTVMDAVVDRFVPLAGHGPYQANASVEHAGYQDTGRTLAGHDPYQENDLSGQGPCQVTALCLEKPRTLVSWSPEDCNAEERNRAVAEQLAELGREVAVEKRTIHKAVYSVISLLKAHHISVGDVTHQLLQEFSATASFDLGEVYRKVVLLWGKWKHHEVLLEDALRAVKADPSLLEGLCDRVVDEQTLLVAGMARFLGAEGQAFVLDQRILARVVGLSGQQAASDLVALLLKVQLLEVVERARYTAKKSTTYRWVGPGAVEPQPEVEVTTPPPPPRRTKVTTPPPKVAAAPLPPTKTRRPGYSADRDDDHRYPTLADGGGYVEQAHHLAEVVLARKFERADLPADFWRDDKYRGEYARQVKAARNLGEEYSLKAVAKAIHSQEAKHIFSFAPSWFKPMVEAAHKAVVQEEKVLAEQRAKAAESPRPAPVQFQSPRPPFCPNGKSLLRKLSKVGT